MLRRFHWLPVVLLLAGALASLAALTLRYRVEARSRAVGLVLDQGQLRTLSTTAGVPLAETYRRFKQAGATHVAVTEETLGELQAEGAIEIRAAATPTGREYRVAAVDPALEERIARHVPRLIASATEQVPPPAGERVVLPGPGGGAIYLPGRFSELRSVPVGLDPAAIAEVREAGLEPVGRLGNSLGLTAGSLRWLLQEVKSQGVTLLIFEGTEVLGFRGLIPETAALFRELGLIYGTVEFGKQLGDEQLSSRLEDRLIRVHSISTAELPRLSPQEAIERYVRASAERNIRLQYVRLPLVVTPRTFDENVEFVEKLSRNLVDARFGLGSPLPFTRVWSDPITGRVVQAVIALGIGAAAALLLAGLVPLRRTLQAGLAVLLGIGCSVLVLVGIGPAPQLVALLAAIVFPTLAFVLYPQPVAAFEEHDHALVPERSEAVPPAVAEFAAISVVTLVGALMVAGLLSELPFLVKTRAFAGIKAATVIPLLLIGWIYITGMTGEYPTWAAEREAMRERLSSLFSEPLRVWHTVALLVALIALLLLLARSGNDPGVGVSSLELRFRALMDRLLGVRPRTKEFLIGHPALLLGLAMASAPRWRPWAFPLLLAGVIGQVGMLNSFCHLHSPLKLTILRTFHGLWMGGLLGLILILLWSFVRAPRPTRPEAGP